MSSSARIGNQPRGGDGAQVVHAVHQVAPAARVVVITGQPDSAPVVRKAVEEGVEEVCHKPLDVTRLLDALDRLAR